MFKKLPYWDNPYNDLSDWQILKKISIEQTQINEQRNILKKKVHTCIFLKDGT